MSCTRLCFLASIAMFCLSTATCFDASFLFGRSVLPRAKAAAATRNRRLLLHFSGSSSSQLSRWKESLEKVPAITTAAPNKLDALLGDKILGLVAAETLTSNSYYGSVVEDGQPDTGSITNRLSRAVSNSFLAQHAPTILGDDFFASFSKSIKDYSKREIGTFVEAVIYRVHTVDPEAVSELARFLVEQSTLDEKNRNFKGLLLELGGSVEIERTGGPDHSPVWSATAELDGQIATTERGGSKRDAENDVAKQILSTAPDSSKTLFECDVETSLNDWQPFEKNMSHKLTDDETLQEWWMRGAMDPKKAFHRASLAPVAFPNKIARVDSWVRRETQNGDITATVFALIATTDHQYLYAPAVTDSSTTRARRRLGLSTNKIIANFVGITLPTQGHDN